MKVDFFVAGNQKAGTTALDMYTRLHPGIQMARRKEPHHFDNEGIDWSHPNHSALHAEYDVHATGVTRGEATPIYSFWPPAPERIRSYNPDAKLVVLFRDPIERAYSHWRMEVSRNAETLSFSEAIRSGRNRLDAARPLSSAWRTYSYVERGDYAQQVRRLLDTFSRDQLLFLKSEDLALNPNTTLLQISRFLNVSLFPAVERLEAHVGIRTFDPITADDISFLRAVYRDSVIEFSSLTGLDVSQWPSVNSRIPHK
jgi:hypothetical protein